MEMYGKLNGNTRLAVIALTKEDWKKDEVHGKRADQKEDGVRETPLTYDDYANMPDDGIRYELAGGRLEAMTPAPQPRHQLFLQELEDHIKATCCHDYVIFVTPIDVIFK